MNSLRTNLPSGTRFLFDFNILQQAYSKLCNCSRNDGDEPKNNQVVEVISWTFLTVLIVFFTACFPAYSENTKVGIFIDKPFYNVNEIPKIFVSGVNRELESRIVDVHVGLIDPSGKIYEYPDWNTILSPLYPSVELPAGFEFPVTLLANAPGFPAEFMPGLWHAGVALTIPGSFEIISSQIVPFSMFFSTEGIERKFGKVLLKLEDDNVTLQGGFLSLSGIFSDTVAFIDGPQTEIEQCSMGIIGFNILSFEPDINARFLDAGSNFFVTANSGVEQKLTKSDPKAFTNYSTTAPNLPFEFYQTGETYTLTSQGGADIGSFRASVIAPRPIVVMNYPNPAEPLVINSNQNLELQWNGNDGIGEVIVTLLVPSFTSDTYIIKCRFADDGIASVPSNLLNQLDKIVNPKNFLPPQVSISRTATAQYRTAEEKLDYGYFEIRAVTSNKFNFAEK